jgi:hypothetical protein
MRPHPHQRQHGLLPNAPACSTRRCPAAQVTDARELAGRLFVSVYMGTVNSGEETRGRAARLAAQIGARWRRRRRRSLALLLALRFVALHRLLRRI